MAAAGIIIVIVVAVVIGIVIVIIIIVVISVVAVPVIAAWIVFLLDIDILIYRDAGFINIFFYSYNSFYCPILVTVVVVVIVMIIVVIMILTAISTIDEKTTAMAAPIISR